MDLKASDDTLARSTNSLEDVCTAVSTDSGDVCGERNGLQILDEFRRLYETRITDIDSNSSNAKDLKMKIMEEWIRDVDAQNVMLVKTVQELEEAAYQRVRILEDKLKHTSTLITDNMSRFEQPTHHRLNDLTDRLDCLEHEEEFLKQKIKNQQNDITGLLKLIKRGYYEHRWSLEGIQLCELRRADIPIPFDGEGESQDPRTPGDKSLTAHEKLKLFSESEKRVSSEESESTTTVDNELELMNLMEELKKKNKEVERLKKQLDSTEKEAVEAREALILEVADKHDQTIILKNQMALLEHEYRQATMKMHFQGDIIKEMRHKLKQQIHTKASSPTPSARNQKSSGVTWGNVSTHELSDQDESHGDGALKNLHNLKSIVKSEQYELGHLKNKLTEFLEISNFHEKMAYEKGLADAHKKLESMENLLENYNIQTESSNFISNTNKLTDALEILSKICLNKSHEILQVELILQNIQVHNNPLETSSVESKNTPSYTPSRPPTLSREDFKMMEEFRICTVEAQAAVEDLQEEMSSVVSNLSHRHQLFSNLNMCLEKVREKVIQTSDDISTAINSLKDTIEEKLISKETISSEEIKLKDLKHEINECLVKFKCRNDTSTHQEKLKEKKYLTALDLGDDFCNSLMDKVVEEIGFISCNLRVFIAKEESRCNLLIKCREELMRLEQSLEELQKFSDSVLQNEDTARNIYEEKLKKLERLERELDDSHTKMQDNLEDIVERCQRYESIQSSYDSRESADSIQCDDSETSNIQMEQLRNAVSSKDKLIEHKDEIIRIQKDSIFVTQEEMKDLQRRLQKKIDAHVVIINEHLEEKKHLLEQCKLQNETINHLQIAVVEAKKNLDRQSGGQKSVGDVWTPITPTVFNNGDVHDV